MAIVALANLKGGVGKSTIAIHLGAALQTPRRAVVAAYLDPQGSASEWAKDGKLPFRVIAIDATRGAARFRLFPFRF